MTLITFPFLDTDEMGQNEPSHYDHNSRQSQQRGANQQQQKSINTLNIINAVLLRKTALNKLSRWEWLCLCIVL